MYLNVKEQLWKELEVQYVALTTDLWTINATEAYFTVTAHYIVDNWKDGKSSAAYLWNTRMTYCG